MAAVVFSEQNDFNVKSVLEINLCPANNSNTGTTVNHFNTQEVFIMWISVVAQGSCNRGGWTGILTIE